MRTLTVIAILLISGSLVASAQTKTEDQRLAEMLREVASECAMRLPNGSVRLSVTPEDTHPVVSQVFAEELSRNNRSVLTGASPVDVRLAVDVRAMNSYTVSQGNSSYLRTVSLDLGVLAGSVREDSVLFSKEFSLARSDTLDGKPPYEEIDLRSASDESWLDSILTPVIASAAAVIIVVLLFTLRGS